MSDEAGTPIGELVPRTPEQGVAFIRRTLLNDREQHKRELADDYHARHRKLGEIDEALRCLDQLERACKAGEW